MGTIDKMEQRVVKYILIGGPKLYAPEQFNHHIGHRKISIARVRSAIEAIIYIGSLRQRL